MKIQAQITPNGPVYYVTDRWGMVKTVTTDKQVAITAAEQKEG